MRLASSTKRPGAGAGPPSGRLCAGTPIRAWLRVRPAQRSGDGGPAPTPQSHEPDEPVRERERADRADRHAAPPEAPAVEHGRDRLEHDGDLEEARADGEAVVLLEALQGGAIRLVALVLGRACALLAGGDVRPLPLDVRGAPGGQLLEVELDRLGLPVRPFIGGAALGQDRLVLAQDALGRGPLRLERGERGEHGEGGGRHRDAGPQAALARTFEVFLLQQLLRFERLAAHRARRLTHRPRRTKARAQVAGTARASRVMRRSPARLAAAITANMAR